MSKFVVGDKVRPADGLSFGGTSSSEIIFVDAIDEGYRIKDHRATWYDHELILVRGGKEMARRTFRQVKESVDSQKGCLWQEQCDDGDQPYIVLESSYDLIKGTDKHVSYVDRSMIEDQPEWFVEVFQVEPQYMTADELADFAEFKRFKAGGNIKAAIKIRPVAKATTSGGAWTPERRARQAEITKKRHAAKQRAARRAAA